MNAKPSPAQERETLLVVASGLVALAVAMGIGRFAFTPIMPLMMRDGTLTAAGGAEWAAANYGGYFFGALTASRFSNTRRGLLLGLCGVALTTAAVAGTNNAQALLGALLRAAAGVFSAWSLVCASSWCLAVLARRRVPHLGAWIYAGVGLGIALAGTLAWLGGRQHANWLWLELGLIAGAGAHFVWSTTKGERAAATEVHNRNAKAIGKRDARLPLVLCYGAFGFGYILPATFLPAMARELAPDPLVFGIAWPLFGMAAALSVAAVAHWMPNASRLRTWALAQGLMALGAMLPLIARTLWAIVASAVLVGGTFMVVTMAGLQHARDEHPDNPTPLLARMTAAFAAGQIAGPLLVRIFGGWDAVSWVGTAAAALLVLTAAWLWRAPQPFPQPHSTARQTR